ncbi:hypothetical protein BSL78_02659, partial [Apostichopus japonicus]
LTPDTYREKFRSAVKGPSETFRQYGSRLSLYLRRWTAPTDRLASSPEFTRIMDLIAVDQMISSLRDESLRLKLLEQKWTSLVEISDFADNILVARVTSRNRQSQGSRSMSATTRPYFHTAGETTGQSQRPASSQASRIRRPATDLNNIRCYTCGNWGHFSYNCSNVSRDQNANVGINLVRISDKEVEERFFSTLDLKSGFWQAAIHPDDQPKTAFVCEEGVYQFKRLPFGLKNASKYFQNLLDVVFQSLEGSTSNNYYPYIDDIVVHSSTIQEHFEDLHKVLECLKNRPNSKSS